MKFLNRNRTLLFLFCFLIAASGLLYSCQKVININLNSAAPQTVVQGNITNQPGPYTVQLTQTVNFSDPNVFPPIDGALVLLKDNLGNTDTLKENTPGNYTGQKLTGTPGRTYSLSITANGKNYSSTSTMAPPVNIDTLTLMKGPFGRDTLINVQFKDPAGVANYYHFIEIINRIQQKQVFVTNDELQDGEEIIFPIFSSPDSLKKGDTVTIQLESIDVNVYNYYSSIMDASGSGDVSPSNPPSNVSNGALGYFSAYAVTSKTIVIP